MTSLESVPGPPVKTVGTIIVDGDDTLWDTQALYERAKDAFFQRLERLGVPREKSSAALERIDVANVAKLGFSAGRFPESLRQTYRLLVEAEGKGVKASDLKEVYEIGRRVFSTHAKLAPDAEWFLRSQRPSHRLVLFTAGDRRVQTRRIEDSGLRSLFDRIEIPPLKDSEAWATLLNSEPESPVTWSVGNSVRSDINPAAALGLKCVLIDRSTWAYEDAVLESDGVWRVSTLAKAAEIIEREDRT